jgi:cysteine-S-conjugate beta-lyase
MSFEVLSRSAPNSRASDPASLTRLFGGGDDLLPLWIAEPHVELTPELAGVLEERAAAGWYGYETRPEGQIDSFWAWMADRHSWSGQGIDTLLSPSIGTSIGVILETLTAEGDGVILQPPVYTGFKPMVTGLKRTVSRNPLVLTDEGYRMDLEDLEAKASDPSTRVLILCSPHNPVGRVWTSTELRAVAEICQRHEVIVLADEIHADITLPGHDFTPFGVSAGGTGVRWAATHGPLKTFGVAGVCESLIVTDDEEIAGAFRTRSSQLHLSRNSVFGGLAFETCYRTGGPWLDGVIEALSSTYEKLERELPDGIALARAEGTYLAWLDFRALGLDVTELTTWLPSEARLALSPGHWFGREGAGFARMTVASRPEVIDEAIHRLGAAVGRM